MHPTKHYADLEIRILGVQDGVYPVEMTLDGEQEYGPGKLSAALPPGLPSADPTGDGERLSAWLFADAGLRAAWCEIRGRHPQRRVRLRIDEAAPELHALPWELLRDVDGEKVQVAAAEATPFSRYIAGKWRPGAAILKRPVRVLVAIANPEGLDAYGLQPVNVEAEIAELQQATEGLDLELTFVEQPCTLAAIERALKDGHHVLHYFGHGAFDPEGQSAALFLADDDGNLALAVDEDIAAMLGRQLADVDVNRQDKLRLVFLGGCQTATRSPADARRGLAPRLVAAGVPAVIAMQDIVSVATARQFAGTFYRHLLEHGRVDLASNEARSEVLTRDLPGAAIPVLFQRLRSGTLLGRRGHVSSNSAHFWPPLVRNLVKRNCLPFLGPGVEEGLVLDRATVAERLAEQNDYPLPASSNDLAQVAQFMALTDEVSLREEYLCMLQHSLMGHLGLKPDALEERFRDAGLSDAITELGWAKRVHEMHESEIHHLLAEFGLPLYVTTNPGGFMYAALERQDGVRPRLAQPRWQPEPGTPQHVLKPKPDPERPVVFHLNGHDGEPDNLVLSKDEYLEHLVRLARDDHEHCLPANLITALASHSFLFLGYRLDSWDFRVLLHGLLAPIKRRRRVNVAVQLEPGETSDDEAAVGYLRRYLERFHIAVYWGSARQFVAELHERWDAQRTQSPGGG